MWFIGFEVEQETSTPPPKKKSWIRPCFSTLKRVFTFVSPLFVWYTSLLGYIDSAKKEYNRQSRKPSSSAAESTL